MNKKLKKTQRKKIIEQNPPLYLSEGYWDEIMLENDSFYDIDIIEKYNAPIRKKIEKLVIEQNKSSSWLGKWYYQIQIDSAKQKLKHYQ